MYLQRFEKPSTGHYWIKIWKWHFGQNWRLPRKSKRAVSDGYFWPTFWARLHSWALRGICTRTNSAQKVGSLHKKSSMAKSGKYPTSYVDQKGRANGNERFRAYVEFSSSSSNFLRVVFPHPNCTLLLQISRGKPGSRFLLVNCNLSFFFLWKKLNSCGILDSCLGNKLQIVLFC